MHEDDNIFDVIYNVCHTKEEYLNFESILRAMFIKYMARVLGREALHCRELERYKCLANDTSLLIDELLIEVPTEDDEFQIRSSDDMFANFCDEKLFIVCMTLSKREKEMIYMKYCKQLTDREIAAVMGTSRQYVTKLRNAMLQTILNKYS